MIHAETDVERIVRYNRAGKWYIEGDFDGGWRMQVPISQAVARAIQLRDFFGGKIHLGCPGGQTFDARVRAADQESRGE